MRRRTHVILGPLGVLLAALAVVGCFYRGYLAGLLPSAAAGMEEIVLPPGFRIAVYAANVPNARQMALGPPGVVFAGSRGEGKVHAVVDRDGDHRADEVHLIAGGLAMPSGVAFRDGALYVGRMFPDRYRGGIFIAEHGSWNRSAPIGYRVTFVKVEAGCATSYETFASGWLRGNVAAGRPADVLVMPDGALLVSDDKAGRIYRISYGAGR